MADFISHTYKYPDDLQEIRRQHGDRCVKCDYGKAAACFINGGTVLCISCAAEWRTLTESKPPFKITFEEWKSYPSLRQMIEERRKQRRQRK